MSTTNDYTPFNGVYTAPDGAVWVTRTLIDPAFKRDWEKKRPGKPWPWPHYGPEYEVAWPRLGKLRIEVESYDAAPVPGRIRAMRVYGRWVHHLEDAKKYGPAPEIKESFKSAEIQTAMVDGKARVIIAPRLVAERLGIDITLVHRYRKLGIPWMPGREPGTLRKPIAVEAQYGYYGRKKKNLFWLEDEVKEFKAAWDALPEEPTEGVIVGSIQDISTQTLSDKNKFSRVEVLCRTDRAENRKGEEKRVSYTIKRRVVPPGEITEYRLTRVQEPKRPPNTLTVKEAALLLKVSEVHILRLFPRASRVKGKILRRQRNFGSKPSSQVREGYFFIPVDKVKEEWKKKRPGELWPLPDTNGQPLSGEQIETLVAATLRQMATSGNMPPIENLAIGSAHQVIVGTATNAELVPQPIESQSGDNPLEPVNSVRLVGKVWHIRYQGESGDYPVNGNKAISWLVKLLETPNRLLTVADLRGDPEHKVAADASMGGERETDRDGLAAIRTRLADIESTIEDTGGTDYLETEKAELLARLENAEYGKQLDSSLRKAHHNIATQIRNVRDKLNEDMPRLAAHLNPAVLKLEFPHLGYYPPANTPPWLT